MCTRCKGIIAKILKAIAEWYIKGIQMELDIEFLNKKVEEFTEKIGYQPINLGELILYELIDTIPTEPHGAKYIIKKGEVYSTW